MIVIIMNKMTDLERIEELRKSRKPENTIYKRELSGELKKV